MKAVKTSLALAVASAFITPLTLANNNQAMEVITVQSDYRQLNLHESTSALSVLSSEDIALRSAQNLEEIVATLPNINFASGAQRARYYQIRGIGERSQFIQPMNSSVGLIVDDIDFSGIGSIASTYDIGQVEVYRGPQGTRFGANALAGIMYMQSNAPTDEFESSMRLTSGNYNSYGAGLVVSGPANDKVNYRMAVEQYKSDGYMENIHLDREDTNNRDELSLRGKLAIQASKDLTIDLALMHFNFDNGYDAFSLDNNRTTYSDNPGFDKQNSTAMSAKFTYTANKAFTIEAVTSMSFSDLDYGYDEDWAFGEYEWRPDDWDNDIYNPDPCITPTGCLAEADGYSSTDHYFRERNNFSGEVRFISNPGEEIFNNSTSWVAGAYVKHETEDLRRQYTYLDADYLSEFDASSYALFAQLETSITQKLKLISGLRFEHRISDFTNSDGVVDKPSDDMLGGKAVLSYQLDNNNQVYASINRGFKAGGVNADGTLPADLRTYDPEYVWNYEVGYKANFLNNTASVRTAVFYMEREDIQISSYNLVERPDGSSEFTSYWANAAQGYNRGIEVEGNWFINEAVEVYGALGLLDTEFSGFTYKDGTEETGRDQAHAPNFQMNLGVNYYPNDNWLVNVSVDSKDGFYFSDSHSEKSSTATVFNGSVTYFAPNWHIKAWVRNMFDKEYATRGFYFGNDPRDGYTDKAYYQFGEPAVFGVTFDYQF
ncbi:TonB-dependent receptor [Thalassotalea sp. PLHSN55]|uniref:TonB-dependent receptor n=1 Tax=Thalassotalea sp. PLHSN55 TaxID=3435888 RepID=UPI003F86BBE5